MFGKFSILQMLMVIIAVAGAIGIVLAVCQAVGVAIPGFLITILWICLAVVVGIVAIKFIASLISDKPPSP